MAVSNISLNHTAVVEFLQGLRARPMDWRCVKCGRMLARARLITGSYVQVRCPKCGHMNAIDDLVEGVSNGNSIIGNGT